MPATDNLKPLDSAANRSKAPAGIECPNPKCRSVESVVPNTHRYPNKVIRHRVCKRCKTKFRTTERRG